MFGITAKLYTVLVFLSSSIYTIGVWLLTPGSLIKNIMLGIGLSVQLLLIFTSYSRELKNQDERFYRNIAKSSSILFTIAIFILLGTLIAVYIKFSF